MHILIACSEAVPFCKTGGLADVCGSLPREMPRLGHQASLVLPAYRNVLKSTFPIVPTGIEFEIPIGRKMVDLYYRHSPPITDYLQRHPLIKSAVKYALIPIAGAAYLSLYIHPIGLIAGFVLLIVIGVYCVRRQSRPPSLKFARSLS